jgi:protein BUR2
MFLTKIVEGSTEFQKWKETILFHEELVLYAICYDLNIEQPYKILLELLKDCASNDLKELSWTLLNDTFKSHLCLKYTQQYTG